MVAELKGLYKIVETVHGNLYIVQSLHGEKIPKALNEKYL
jgi:hypothetical protein